MSLITPCLWFAADAGEAAELYTRIFPDGATLSTTRYGEGMPLPAGTPLLIELTIGGQRFQLLNGGPMYRPTPSISFFVQLASAEAAQPVYDALRAGGKVMMPLGAWPWSPCYAWVEDRFGVSWQLIVGEGDIGPAAIVPCFMFAGAQHGRAAEAMALWTGLFPGAEVGPVEQYAEGEGPAGTIKHGRFRLGGQGFVAMDAHGEHGFTFTEGVSLAVRCADQAAVDHYWDGLTADGGEPGRCGWLKDRFGVSWQIVPEKLLALQARGDAARTGRMFQALMGMGRLDAAELERAWEAG
ncbi:MAG: VOC family protein [Myxococcales bacterium]|nr:VOC family protein [Myxococcales bacterium]